MPKFKYVVKDQQGKNIIAEAEAFDRAHMIQQLQKDGYFIISVEEALPILEKTKAHHLNLASFKKFTHRSVKLADLLTFSRQLTTLLESGVILLRSLEVITVQVESERLHKILGRVTQRVEEGVSLSEAMAEHPKVFNPFWVSLVEVGEASGTMPAVLSKLTFYLEQEAAFKTAITSAVLYPAILFCVCLGAIAFFALFVGPRFENIFNSMKVELPLITKILLTSFRLIKKNFLTIVVVIAFGIFFLKKWARTPFGRTQTEKALFSMPIFGKIYKLIIIERFSSQMALLVDSGVPILYALDITIRLVDNSTCSRIIEGVKESVRGGELLVAPMERSKFFPPMMLQMITVGEETGELSRMLQQVANFYQGEVETFMKRFGTVIEPIMLVFMGTMIGIIVIAMFLPMFNIAQLGGG